MPPAAADATTGNETLIYISPGAVGQNGSLFSAALNTLLTPPPDTGYIHVTWRKTKVEYNLERFREAQRDDYKTALKEIRNGRKQSHWMWYIFPQLRGLGHSPRAQYYAIADRAEAEAYIQDEVLGERLVEISYALLSLDEDDPTLVMGYPDDMKLRSCMTLFAAVAPAADVFEKVLDRFYSGKKDERTIELLGKK